MKNFIYSLFSSLESSVSVAAAVSSLLCSISVCPTCGASKGWAVNYSLLNYCWLDDWFSSGSITFSSVVSIGICFWNNLKILQGTLTVGLFWFCFSDYFGWSQRSSVSTSTVVVRLLVLSELLLPCLWLVLEELARLLLALEEQFQVLVRLLLGLRVLGEQLGQILLEYLDGWSLNGSNFNWSELQ